IDMKVTRDEFEALIMESVLDTQRTIDEALESASLTENDIDAVILVGGSSRIPLVKETINNKFLNKVKDDINPDTAVALGAAIQAGIKTVSENPTHPSPIVTDKSSYNLGVAVSGMLDNQQRDDIFSKIIEKDNSIPCTKRKIYTTTRNNQTSVTIPIYEGDYISVHKNVKIGEVVLDNIPMAKAGGEDISVDFSYDLNGIIKVVATVMSTGIKIDTEIDLSNVVEPVSGGLMEKYFDEKKDNVPKIAEKIKKTTNSPNNDDYKKYPLYKSVENSMKFAESMSKEVDSENIKTKLSNVLENMKSAIISNNKTLLEKYEMELTDILFEI
ncbi:MAG: Hsp70 family protein, partial [Romboutsia sp.]|nr:Hsp70 family protein [Romboutsia sp.]